MAYIAVCSAPQTFYPVTPPNLLSAPPPPSREWGCSSRRGDADKSKGTESRTTAGGGAGARSRAEWCSLPDPGPSRSPSNVPPCRLGGISNSLGTSALWGANWYSVLCVCIHSVSGNGKCSWRVKSLSLYSHVKTKILLFFGFSNINICAHFYLITLLIEKHLSTKRAKLPK